MNDVLLLCSQPARRKLPTRIRCILANPRPCIHANPSDKASLFRVCFNLRTRAHVCFARTHPPPPAMTILATPLRYADIYTSRVSNLIRYSPFMYFRSPSQTLAHDKNN